MEPAVARQWNDSCYSVGLSMPVATHDAVFFMVIYNRGQKFDQSKSLILSPSSVVGERLLSTIAPLHFVVVANSWIVVYT